MRPVTAEWIADAVAGRGGYQARDATSGGTQMLLGAELPTGLASGYYSLTVIITDPVAGTQTQGTMSVWVGDD